MGNFFVDGPVTREARTVNRTLEIAAGAILLLVGVTMLVTAAWGGGAVAWASFRHGKLPVGWAWGPWTLAACVLALAIFAAQVGFRLVWHRPNVHGSLLSPAGWATLGFVFVGIAAAMSLAAPDSGLPERQSR